MCGFVAQLVEHRTGIAEVTGSNPVKALIFFRLLLSSCLNWKIYCDDHISLSCSFLAHCLRRWTAFSEVNLSCGLAQWWKHLPPTAVIQAQFPWPAVTCIVGLRLASRVFSRFSRFSCFPPSTKTNRSKFQYIQSGNEGHRFVSFAVKCHPHFAFGLRQKFEAVPCE